MLIKNTEQLKSLDMREVISRPAPRGLIVCTPEGFQVKEVHNHFMQGNVGRVELETAARDWHTLHDVLAKMTNVQVMQGEPDCPDMIFTANAALTVALPNRPKIAVMSSMMYPSRRAETPHFETFLRARGYEILTLPSSEGMFYEGQGDSLWHPGRALLWGGYGKRSTPDAYEHIAALLDVPIILLELVSELYHLDTCFCPLDEETVLYCPTAFTSEGSAMIEKMFPETIQVNREEGMTFACNTVVVGNRVVMPKGAEAVGEKLKAHGFEPTFVPMHQMLKSGGAVRCCTLDDY